MSGEEENENNATFSGVDFGPRVGGMTADGLVEIQITHALIPRLPVATKLQLGKRLQRPKRCVRLA